MNNPVRIPAISKCIELFGNDNGTNLYKSFQSAEFRNATSLYDQIHFIKNEHQSITVREIIKLFSITNDHYYKALRNVPNVAPVKPQPPSRQLLTEKEEMALIDLIRLQQLQKDCWEGKDIRSAASDIYKTRTGIDRSFSSDWMRDFRERHKNLIEKVIADSLEEDRSQISLDEVNQYIHDIENMMLDPPNPYLLINFDEIGFDRRPDKGKRKKVYIFKECNVKPFFRETEDLHHISLVVGITAACTDIPPLYISTRKKFDDDINDTFFLRRGTYCSTRKGYMSIPSMLFWIKYNLAPYVKCVREILNENLRCVVICDGLKSHFHEFINDELSKIGNIQFIKLPSHSSHITQMLDISAFNALKKRYGSITPNYNYNSEFTRKLMKIKNAYQSTMIDELIRSSWEGAGFHLNLDQGDVVSYSFSQEFKDFLRAEATHEDTQ